MSDYADKDLVGLTYRLTTNILNGENATVLAEIARLTSASDNPTEAATYLAIAAMCAYGQLLKDVGGSNDGALQILDESALGHEINNIFREQDASNV